MALSEIINKDLQSIASDLGDPVIEWKGEEYECIPSATGTSSNLEDGGFSIDADLLVSVRKELFTDEIYPKSQQTITYNDVGYRIITVRNDATNTFVRLFCNNLNRGV